MEKHPHVIQPPNIKESLFVKINSTLVHKRTHLLQISVRELHNDIILSISQGDCIGARTVDGKVYFGDTSLTKYMPKYIEPMSNINKITCVCKTCISAMLL